MSRVRGWHGSGSKEISHRWGGDRGYRVGRGILGLQQSGTLVEGYYTCSPPQNQHCGVFHLEQLTDTIAS